MINDILYQIKNQINKNSYLNTHHLTLMDEIQTKELNFLQRKRENDQLKPRINNDFAFQKESFTIQKNESRNAKNEPQSYHINFEVKNCKNSFAESLDNSNSNDNNKFKIITDDKKTNLINTNFIDKISSKSIKNFNKYKCPFDANNNNEIKVLKNKKEVYINSYLLNSYSTSRSLKKLKKLKFEIRKKTTSKYRGVSKNGNKWQVLIMINNKKYYIGSYLSEEIAARIYDILAIKNRGIQARTNFIYNNAQITKIKESILDLKSDNISDILVQLIN
jgi:hypothetical protein